MRSKGGQNVVQSVPEVPGRQSHTKTAGLRRGEPIRHTGTRATLSAGRSATQLMVHSLTPGGERALTGSDIRMSFLCAFAFLNPLVVQLSFFIAPNARVAGLSVPQLFQGIVFSLSVLVILLSRWQSTVHTRRAGQFLLLAVFASTVILLKTAADYQHGFRLAYLRSDLIFLFKIVFWSFMWWFVAIVVRRKQEAERLLRALLLGALLAAVVVIASYVTGAGRVSAYERAGIVASVGASGVSPKQTVAYLAPCALVAMYLGRKRYRFLSMGAGFLLLCSVLVSYDRSIQVGVVLAALWLLVWRTLLSGRRVSKNWSLGLLMAGGLGAVILFSSVGVESLVSRWTRDFEQGMPGSGRLDFYQGAVERFADGSVADMLVGVGYTGITDAMRDRCGLPIHTHSDLFDLLLGGGLIGLAVYFCLLRNLFRYWRTASSQSAEFALMGACLAIFLVMSLITGQLEATHAMFCLGASLHCCSLLAQNSVGDPKQAVRRGPPSRLQHVGSM